MLADVLDARDEIAPVPDERRRLGAFSIGVLWFDLGVGLLVLVAGSLLVPGLSLRDALIAAFIGSVLGSALLAVVGRIGSNLGVPTMVALRSPLGIRGSYVASLLNIGQLIGWAGLEFIIMAQAARAISNEFFGFDGYYMWLAVAAVLGTAFAVLGPIAVIRDFLERFGVWIVLAATIWLTWRLFSTYDIQSLFGEPGEGGFPNFWQGVDIAVSLPVSWLPLVADYSRYARRSEVTGWATFASYAAANTWFFALGAGYVLVLAATPLTLIGALVDSMLLLSVGWLFLLVVLVDETDNAFANVYSTSVSLQNMLPGSQRVFAVLVGIAALILAVSVDILGYENFLLLVGGVFVSLFGVLVADYFIVRRGRYDASALYRRDGPYWYTAGVNIPGLAAWAAGFVVYVACAQPPALVEHATWITDVPSWMTRAGGTVPSLLVSTALYLALVRTVRRTTDRLAAGALPPAAR
jgi:putative hydroxymethylpyrimidine transporter CytX